jgi:hypothetical protein
MLVTAHRDGDAAAQLTKAIAVDPYYAPPHMLLARIADVEQYTDDAVREYQSYVALTTRSDPQRSVAQARLSALRSTVASTPAPTPYSRRCRSRSARRTMRPSRRAPTLRSAQTATAGRRTTCTGSSR